MESGIHSSLHSNCHHQIVFVKLNLSILCPPPSTRTMWYYENANTELITRAIDQFDWLGDLSNVNVDEKRYAVDKYEDQKEFGFQVILLAHQKQFFSKNLKLYTIN